MSRGMFRTTWGNSKQFSLSILHRKITVKDFGLINVLVWSQVLHVKALSIFSSSYVELNLNQKKELECFFFRFTNAIRYYS